MQDIRQQFIDIKSQVEKRVFDSYLLQYVETPIIDDDKLLILISILDWLELSYSEIQNYSLSTMLIQIGLDTHEHIMNSAEDEKRRQLTVLAGDYFSGLYYKLLADSENILMIRTLSYGVKEVNEHKVSFYQKETIGIENLMTDIRIIESSLIVKLAGYFKADSWIEFIADFLFFKRLLKEKAKYIQDGNSLLLECIKKDISHIKQFESNGHSCEQQNDLLQICDCYLESSKQLIEKGMKKLPHVNELLRGRVSSLLNQHRPIEKTFVEEG